MGGPQPFRQGAGGHSARLAARSSHPARGAPVLGGCWVLLGSVCLNARGPPRGSTVSPAGTGLGSEGRACRPARSQVCGRCQGEDRGLCDPPPLPSSRLPLHTQTSLQALALCPTPAGDGFQPLTFAVLHVVSSEVEEEGEQPRPSESGGRSLRPHCGNSHAEHHHLSAIRPLAAGGLLFPVCACGFPVPGKPPSLLPSCSFSATVTAVETPPEVPAYKASPPPSRSTSAFLASFPTLDILPSHSAARCSVVCPGLRGTPGSVLAAAAARARGTVWRGAGVRLASSSPRPLNE